MSQIPEITLFTQIEACIKMAAQLSALSFDHPHVNNMSNRSGFPPSPEKHGPNIRTDNFVLITDCMHECTKHLLEARKQLLMLGVQPPNKHREVQDEEEVSGD
jgi:hypothetical protein